MHGEKVQQARPCSPTRPSTACWARPASSRCSRPRRTRASCTCRTAQPVGQVRGQLRPARRLLEHRRQRQHRDHLLDPAAGHPQRAAARSRTACRPGSGQLAAGYVMYGSSTMLVYTTGDGVHGFTYEPSIGEFLLSHPNIRTPGARPHLQRQRGQLRHAGPRACSATSTGSRPRTPATGRPYSARYVGSLVADFHRNLLYGGIFLYPADRKNPNGKLRAALRGARRSRSSPSRPAARPATARAASWTSRPTRSTSARRSSSAAPRTCASARSSSRGATRRSPGERRRATRRTGDHPRPRAPGD